uniref:Uncharacterized protein n=1 Tax=Romanomermis culicivorax TaxID=13658 RepID=A0A915LAR0_ROMCU
MRKRCYCAFPSEPVDLTLLIQVMGPDLNFCDGRCCSRNRRCRALQYGREATVQITSNIGGKEDSSETSELKNKGGQQSKESNSNKSNFWTNIEHPLNTKRPKGENEMEEKRRTKGTMYVHSDAKRYVMISLQNV